ncbi:hypothetical protein ANCCAN_04621 [Ancylostoma caninum]|uniref:Reverse transcriptase domain-containing protein n=1 Tax=Ancylostoma caninum TaxID=29170 RepID=A0A368H282_ANCCA|nr:hypothetical protein ANCCAN_04621 [Ancylostoma caninum]
MLYLRSSSVERCLAGINKLFLVHIGLNQVSALYPLLFILCERHHQGCPEATSNSWCILHADDVMIAAETKEQLEAECGAKNEDGTIYFNGSDLNKVRCFKYLGSVIASTGDIVPNAHGRGSAAWMKWRMTTDILCEKKIPIRLEFNVNRILVTSNMLSATAVFLHLKVSPFHAIP